jgi:hypothetical protein
MWRNTRLVAPVAVAYTAVMESTVKKLTGQGVRDLNHTGPRRKPTSEAAPAQVGTVDESLPPLTASTATPEDAAPASAVPNG